jgi:hypothetical protein
MFFSWRANSALRRKTVVWRLKTSTRNGTLALYRVETYRYAHSFGGTATLDVQLAPFTSGCGELSRKSPQRISATNYGLPKRDLPLFVTTILYCPPLSLSTDRRRRNRVRYCATAKARSDHVFTYREFKRLISGFLVSTAIFDINKFKDCSVAKKGLVCKSEISEKRQKQSETTANYAQCFLSKWPYANRFVAISRPLELAVFCCCCGGMLKREQQEGVHSAVTANFVCAQQPQGLPDQLSSIIIQHERR